jgi:hypothetical protein
MLILTKTKIMIFEQGRPSYDIHFFLLNSIPLEVVTSFKYLGITLFKNGHMHRTQKKFAQHS